MKNKIVLNLLSLVGIILLSGCASSEPQTGGTSNQAWYQAGMSAEQTRRDLADCQNEALVNGRSFSPIPAQDAGASIALGMLASSSEKSRQNQIVQTCMAAKGYSLVNTNSPLLANSQPTQAQQSAVDFKLFEDVKVKAENGNAIAQYNLGYCYSNGRGVEKNSVEEVKWYRKAAEQGYAEAQYNLGINYANGTGVLKDYVEGYKWILLASANGHKLAPNYIPQFERQMTPDQINEGHKLAREFKPITSTVP